MIWVGLSLIVIAGIAEHFKDLSEEGKIKKPYWMKGYIHPDMSNDDLWWKVGWMQGGIWDKIPVWVRQYLSFRDGWHLLKFVSLNFFALGVVVLFSVEWWWFIVVRFAFSSPETILRKLGIYKKLS